MGDSNSHMAFLDLEAIHSGGEESIGTSEVEEVESDSDRRFIKDVPNTQVSPSYNQQAAYRYGLMTQVPEEVNAPKFQRKAKRNGRFTDSKPERVHYLTSSQSVRQESDNYSIGSFVVEDEILSDL